MAELRGGESGAAAINEAGVVVGSLGQIYAGRPARWSSADAAPTVLPLPAGVTTGEARGIDEDGTIYGMVGTKKTEETGYLWLPGGAGRAMPLPTVDGTKASYFFAESIRDG